MIDLRALARAVGLIGLCLSSLVSHAAEPSAYIPDGPDVPTVVLNEGQSGAAAAAGATAEAVGRAIDLEHADPRVPGQSGARKLRRWLD